MNKILVVDDDKTTRHVLRTVLTKAGFSTSVAKDGVEALKALRSARFNLLLLDVWMPRMNGLDLLERAPRDRSAAPRDRDDVRRRAGNAAESGARTGVQYVHKPVDALRSCKPFATCSPAPARLRSK